MSGQGCYNYRGKGVKGVYILVRGLRDSCISKLPPFPSKLTTASVSNRGTFLMRRCQLGLGAGAS